jgi:hypothetical protein
MPLTMREPGLASPVDQSREDFTIYSGGWAVGRIHEQCGGPEQWRREQVPALVHTPRRVRAETSCASKRDYLMAQRLPNGRQVRSPCTGNNYIAEAFTRDAR